MPDSTPADEIAASLARLRGRRGPRPPWEGGPRGGPHPGHRGHDRAPGEHRGPWGDPRWGGPARMRVLEAVAAASAPLTVSEIADAVGVDQPRASRLVQQVVSAGLARREADPDDARRTRVALTTEGATLVRRFRGRRRDAVDTALAGFTDDERAELARLLAKLADAWPE